MSFKTHDQYMQHAEKLREGGKKRMLAEVRGDIKKVIADVQANTMRMVGDWMQNERNYRCPCCGKETPFSLGNLRPKK